MSDLAKKIARVIFEAGDEPNDKVQRIAFKGGTWTFERDKETDLGGLAEGPLADLIAEVLKVERINR